jgi:hypothetical protein
MRSRNIASNQTRHDHVEEEPETPTPNGIEKAEMPGGLIAYEKRPAECHRQRSGHHDHETPENGEDQLVWVRGDGAPVDHRGHDEDRQRCEGKLDRENGAWGNRADQVMRAMKESFHVRLWCWRYAKHQSGRPTGSIMRSTLAGLPTTTA